MYRSNSRSSSSGNISLGSNGSNPTLLNLSKKTMRRQAEMIRSKFRKVITGNEKRRIRDAIKDTGKRPTYIKFFDKVTFTFGVLILMSCEYFLLNKPTHYWLWYSIIFPVILLSRLIYFRTMLWAYFLFDFCYFSIFLSFINMYVLYNSTRIFKIW